MIGDVLHSFLRLLNPRSRRALANFGHYRCVNSKSPCRILKSLLLLVVHRGDNIILSD